MKKKRFLVTGGLTMALTLLSGCVRTTKSGKPYGMVYDYLAKPMQHLMEWFAGLFGNSYGWAIVALVVVVRLILLPLMMSQMKKVHHDARAHGDATTTDAGTPGTAKAGEDPRRTGGR